MTVWWLALALAQAPDHCALLEHETIAAGDLAAAMPAFAQLPPELAIAPAPAPGTRRLFRAPELAALARSHGIEAGASQDLCFEWKMEPLDRGSLAAAMQAALPYPETHIEVLETSVPSAPPGRFEFRREDLGASASKGTHAPVVWRGNVLYGAGRRFSIWARVLIATPPAVIHSGDVVDVEVRSGAARLILSARSASDGRPGEIISLRNLTSNKLFQARVAGKGKAFVDAAVTSGNQNEP